jgi:hypothetical protein
VVFCSLYSRRLSFAFGNTLKPKSFSRRHSRDHVVCRSPYDECSPGRFAYPGIFVFGCSSGPVPPPVPPMIASSSLQIERRLHSTLSELGTPGSELPIRAPSGLHALACSYYYALSRCSSGSHQPRVCFGQHIDGVATCPPGLETEYHLHFFSC